MKKYISICGLLSVFLMESCERPHDEMISGQQEELKMKPMKNPDQNNGTSSKNEDPAMYESPDPKTSDTGDDDEPRRDKQHWRPAKDSVW